ncbi:MAG: amidophosphoribosyltransferase [Chloroflexota bacterium]|nr:amidophosphoribosyltransferase [Chloroflexota bacterium]
MTDHDDDLKEACGVVGVYSPNHSVARVVFFALYALQHRGQESSGIAASDGNVITNTTAMGLVGQAFQEEDLTDLSGHVAIGHTRYSTTGSNNINNAQPILSKSADVEIALAHNGNVINAVELKKELVDWGCEFSSTSDSEIVAHLITHAPSSDWGERIAYAMRRLEGAYSLAVMTKDALFGIRDPLGVRPLCIGKLDDGWVIASESCALDHVGAEFVREIDPGEAVMVDSEGLRTVYKKEEAPESSSMCIFEHIYFARPDSILGGNLVYKSRMAMGAELAKEHPVDADIVIGVPDSATAAAVGYSQEAQIPFSEGLMKNRYVGRTFILPDQRLRDLGVRRKLNPLPDLIRDKRVVVVDDSIVRGTTTPHVVNLLRKGGATEIHLRVCAPPIMWPCHFGIDMATRKELLAANKTVEQIREYVGADSLGYLSHEGLLRAVDADKNKFCMACFTGEYPVPVQLEMDKLVLEI